MTREFLNKHKYLKKILKEGTKHIANIFPPETIVSLEMFNFADENQDILIVNIMNDKIKDEDMIAYLDKFDKKWWLLNIQKVNQKLIFEIAKEV